MCIFTWHYVRIEVVELIGHVLPDLGQLRCGVYNGRWVVLRMTKLEFQQNVKTGNI